MEIEEVMDRLYNPRHANYTSRVHKKFIQELESKKRCISRL